MRSKSVAVIIIIAFLFSIIPINPVRAQEPPASEPRKTFLAVLELDCKGGLSPDECFLLSDTLREQFLLTGRFRVVDRSNMKTLLKEQEFQLQDCTSQECAVKIGQLLGVEKMAFGSVGKLGDVFSLNLQIINVETGEIENAASDRCPCAVSDLVSPLTRLVLKVSGGKIKEKDRTLAEGEQKQEEYGSLEINTDPSRVAVYLDSELLGYTPDKIEKIPAGPHNLTLTKDGFATISKGVVVKPNQQTRIEEILVEQTGSVEVVSSPPGAEIYLDDTSQGKTPKTLPDQKIGRHQLRLEHPDYLPIAAEVEIFYQKTVRFEKNLEGKPGKLLITSTPAGAEVYLDGNRKGKTNLSIEVPPGDHEVTTSKEGFFENKKDIRIRPNQPETLDLSLAPLAISSDTSLGSNQREPAGKPAGSRGKPWHKKAWVWVIVAGVVGGGAYGTYALINARNDEGHITFRW